MAGILVFMEVSISGFLAISGKICFIMSSLIRCLVNWSSILLELAIIRKRIESLGIIISSLLIFK